MHRHKLPENRVGLTIRRCICGLKCYITVNFYENSNKPAEVFIDIAKHGSVISGLVDTWATTLSIAFQYHVPWETLRTKFINRRFDPIGEKYTSLADGVANVIDELIQLQRKIINGTST